MTTLLKINASLFSTQGQSSQLAERFVAARLAATPGLKVISRDLGAEPVPHLDAARFLSFLAKPEERSAEQQAVVAYSDALIEELRQADEIVIGLPMYNFGVPSTLKAWFDHIARAGVTFRYTATGPEGLLTGKKVTIFAARGGLYAGTPKDSQTTYVRDFLAFIGITDVEFVYAEGLNMGDESKAAALTAAHGKLAELAA
ncbi:NAD(P)H-dependent oxidoreductase [Zoogloea sp.]|jgi:FMN-dependent NADH-azoreductase|uniref:FMN-dependent NADH-azoreductase n=1 Tax=Zoogloea sp. TaxID=49181 RepID=UPI001D71D087|nr:NAD(P)H-dependent oxidoreductase [Zoogloea sp.]MBK6654221.1 NAD(P)H-dependent oxidoreductase [Zoogloea sp.]HPI60496.1 NAD(P)H-dependent oxidoreductase [Zoogloea sp.]